MEPRVSMLETGGLRWIQLESPGPAEIAWLEEEFSFHELDLEDVRSRRQRPKVDEYPDYVFVVLHFPWYDKQSGRLFPAEVNAFIGPDFLITIPNVPLKPVSNVFRRLEANEEERAEWFAKGSGFLFYEVLDSLYGYCFPILDQIGRKLEDIEDHLFERDPDESVVRMISNVKQEIISYRKITKPQRPVLRQLERAGERYLASEDLDIYYDDLVDSAERIWDLLENYKEVAEALEQTNETAISHRQNRILQVLTVLTVVFLPVTFVTNLFGMNVPVPFDHVSFAFAAILAVLVSTIAVLLGIFKWLRWV
ncbi:MAG: magnesium transporter CorA family protein [Actinobacteria bacterium]|jgi:magnesium transporter|nr:magnesium transporter CorA family protein [Actinomycetota bacterium]